MGDRISEIVKLIGGIVGALIVLWYIVGLIRVIWYERKINEIKDLLEKSRKEIKKEGISVDGINARMAELEREHHPKLEKFERKRKFILEKLPFIRK